MTAASTKIITVSGLIKALRNKPQPVSYLSILNAIDIPQREFEQFYYWTNDHYSRISLTKSNDFELLLVCWEKGQNSSIHDFDSQEAWIHPIQGEIIEEQFVQTGNRLEKVSAVRLGPSEFSYMAEPISIHRYSNSYESRTVSLHLYAGPVEKWKAYDEKTLETSQRTVQYDIVHQFDNDGRVINS